MSEDTISRQAAIEALKEAFNPSIVNFVKAKIAIENLPSAQPETHEERTETHACDSISRQAVIEINRSYHGQMPNEVNHRIWKEINELPSAQPDLSGYSDKLWQKAYERGREEAQRTGRWIDHVEDGYVECPFCHSATNCDDNISDLHFCFSCGARMEDEG